MAKMDIKEAYRLAPVHPEDRLLLGMTWQDTRYIDKTLPFGLRSAPLIFSALADGLEWVIRRRGVEYKLHYVDDLIVLGHPGTDECANGMSTSISTMEELGAHVDPDKNEGPSTCLPFLGVEVDTIQLEVRLPLEKTPSPPQAGG